ncbi:MAG: hypothetical protein BMS9Abin36_1317 [Gammaproteobacteria bacterium]|nr:MAG: hypothetical protein BMS9Abin36_1317 [Gammaproteobacteria bacterium]
MNSRHRGYRESCWRRACDVLGLVFLLLAVLPSLAPAAGADGEFLVFLEAGGAYRPDPPADSGLDNSDTGLAVDLFYAKDYGRMRILGELFANNNENSDLDLERLQLGWQVRPDTLLWLGRYHAPLGYWNTAFHHGTYLETAASRPTVTLYDEHGGSLPSHLTGLLLEGRRPLGDRVLRYAWAIGAGPQLAESLEPVDFLRPSGSHKPSTVLRISYSPNDLSLDETGVFAAYTEIPVIGAPPINEVDQTIVGAFVNREWNRTRILGAGFYVDNTLRRAGGSARDSFTSAYLQAEYDWRSEWTFFGRLEGSSGAEGDAYLSLLPTFITQRVVAGINYALTRHQSVRFELSDNRIDAGQYDQVVAKWAAVFP